MSYTNVPNDTWDCIIDNPAYPNTMRIWAIVFRYTVCFHREFHELSLSFMGSRLNIRRDNLNREIKKMIDDGLLKHYCIGQKRFLAIGNVIKNDNVSDIESDNRSVINFDNQEIKNNKLKKDISSEFESFWNCYPRKDAKADAEKAFSTAIKKAPLEIILDGCKGYASQIERDHTEKRFIKLAGGWLRSERWNDFKQKQQEESKIHRLIELHSRRG